MTEGGRGGGPAGWGTPGGLSRLQPGLPRLPRVPPPFRARHTGIRPWTRVRALAGVAVLGCAACTAGNAGGAGSPDSPVAPPGSGAAVSHEPAGAGAPDPVRLRLAPFAASYRVGVTSARLDEEGAVLEEREQEVALQLAVGSDVTTGRGAVAVTAESLSPPREPEAARYPADSLGAHPVNEWRGGSWVAPLLPLVSFSGEAVGVGDRWTVRRRVLLTTSELEGGSTVEYRLQSVDGDRATLSFTGRASGNRRVEQGEMGTGRPVILAASTRTRGEAVVDRLTGRVIRMTRTDDLTVTVEPLDARDAAGETRQVLQRLRMEMEARTAGAGSGGGRQD